jgi:hypothetical protein
LTLIHSPDCAIAQQFSRRPLTAEAQVEAQLDQVRFVEEVVEFSTTAPYGSSYPTLTLTGQTGEAWGPSDKTHPLSKVAQYEKIILFFFCRDLKLLAQKKVLVDDLLALSTLI